MNSSDEPGVEMENRDLEIGSSDGDEPVDYGKETDDEVDHSGTASRSDLPASDGELTTRAKFIPVTLAFKNLFFSVKVRKGKNPFQKKHKKTLLKDLHGELRPGEVTAIMGPSGTLPTHLSSLFRPPYGQLLMSSFPTTWQGRARRRCSTCSPAACRAARPRARSRSMTSPRTTSPAAGGSD
jgi:ABC-type glutathione transport system ATPase component